MEAGGTASQARREGAGEAAGRTLAQVFCLVVGIVLIAAGILGFIFGSADFAAGGNVQGTEFIIFEVNGWHNIVHIATGVFLVAMAATPSTAVTGALVFGVLYVVVTVWGFIDGNDVISLVPINMADNWLHLALAVLGIVIGASAGGMLGAARRDTTTA